MKLGYIIVILSLSFGGSVAAGPMEFAEHFSGAMRIDRNSTWISAEGEITAETPANFEKFLASAFLLKGQRIAISSPGGSVLGGMKLGAIIRQHQFETVVAKSVRKGAFSSFEPGECASSCVFAFAGGIERSIVAPSRLGVHQISIDHKSLYTMSAVSVESLDLTFATSQVAIGLTISHFLEMGIDPNIVTMMTTKAATEIRWLSEAELASTKIRYDPKVFSDWAIEPYKAGLVAFTKSMDGSRQLTLFCSGGRMQFRLIANGGVYTTNFASSVVGAKAIEIAGLKIAKKNFTISDVKGGMVIYGDWTSTDTDREPRSTFSLFGEVTGSAADLYSMYSFNERRFNQSLRLVRKNCVS